MPKSLVILAVLLSFSFTSVVFAEGSAEFPLYLNPPEKALYNWIPPSVTNVVLTPSCGTAVVLDRAPGSISFGSNVTG
jgi:hypothetical protein